MFGHNITGNTLVTRNVCKSHVPHVLGTKNGPNRYSTHTLVCWMPAWHIRLQSCTCTWAAQAPPPTASLIGLLRASAAYWQIWIQRNRQKGRRRRSGVSWGGRCTSLSQLSLSLPLSLCLYLTPPGQDGKARTVRGGNMSWEVMTQPRRSIHILTDSQVCCSPLPPPPLLLCPAEERGSQR